jgi:23S rRNA (guanosine2251-2'-O)-methyltransferase
MHKRLDYEHWEKNIKKLPLQLVLENIQDSSNLGAILRICDALCVEKLIWSGNAPEQMRKKVRRVARGADGHVPFFYEENLLERIKTLKIEGFTIVGIEITTESKPLQTIDFQSFEKIILIAGAEQIGISDELLALCDHVAHIPMHGSGFSMNVSSAVAIALYEVVRGQ